MQTAMTMEVTKIIGRECKIIMEPIHFILTQLRTEIWLIQITSYFSKNLL